MVDGSSLNVLGLFCLFVCLIVSKSVHLHEGKVLVRAINVHVSNTDCTKKDT
jgi:hypothetical protein